MRKEQNAARSSSNHSEQVMEPRWGKPSTCSLIILSRSHRGEQHSLTKSKKLKLQASRSVVLHLLRFPHHDAPGPCGRDPRNSEDDTLLGPLTAFTLYYSTHQQLKSFLMLHSESQELGWHVQFLGSSAKIDGDDPHDHPLAPTIAFPLRNAAICEGPGELSKIILGGMLCTVQVAVMLITLY